MDPDACHRQRRHTVSEVLGVLVFHPKGDLRTYCVVAIDGISDDEVSERGGGR